MQNNVNNNIFHQNFSGYDELKTYFFVFGKNIHHILNIYIVTQTSAVRQNIRNIFNMRMKMSEL